MQIHNRLDGQRILVTGASGFIGSHLCRRLLQEGAEVHAVYRSRHPRDFGDQHWWQADLSDGAEVRKIVSKARPDPT
jgi:nucleoside-diphosphate-sugar epimerase